MKNKELKRLIPCLFNKDNFLIRSKQFYLHQNIGNFINQAQRFFEWNVDELIYINLGQNNQINEINKKKIVKIIEIISKKCFLPLTVGGKITNMSQAEMLIRNGADKLVINSSIYKNSQLIRMVTNLFGSQALVASIDYRIIEGKPILFVDNGSLNTKKNINNWIKYCEDLGVGEFFLNSIDRDGTGKGFDIRTINQVSKITELPIIACGGAGNEDHFYKAFKQTDISALAAGNYFHFKENAYPNLKKYLKTKKIALR
jgi:cyclase